MNKNDISSKILTLFDKLEEHDGLFEFVSVYLDAIIYLLNERGIITNDELEFVINQINEQNSVDKSNSIDKFQYKTGFFNPPIGDA